MKIDEVITELEKDTEFRLAARMPSYYRCAGVVVHCHSHDIPRLYSFDAMLGGMSKQPITLDLDELKADNWEIVTISSLLEASDRI